MDVKVLLSGESIRARSLEPIRSTYSGRVRMEWWHWLLIGVFFGTGIGLFASGLCHQASERRHDRRIQSQIAGRSYFDASRGEG